MVQLDSLKCIQLVIHWNVAIVSQRYCYSSQVERAM